MYGSSHGLTTLPATGAASGAAFSVSMTLGVIVTVLTVLFAVAAMTRLIPTRHNGE